MGSFSLPEDQALLKYPAFSENTGTCITNATKSLDRICWPTQGNKRYGKHSQNTLLLDAISQSSSVETCIVAATNLPTNSQAHSILQSENVG